MFLIYALMSLVALMGVALLGMALMGVALMGVALMGVALIGTALVMDLLNQLQTLHARVQNYAFLRSRSTCCPLGTPPYPLPSLQTLSQPQGADFTPPDLLRMSKRNVTQRSVAKVCTNICTYD